MATLPPRSDDVASRTPLIGDPSYGAPRSDSLESALEVELPAEAPEGPISRVEELEDGSAVVYDAEAPRVPERRSEKFLENLVEVLDPAVLARTARETLEAIERDEQDRSERDKKYAEGLKRTGLGGEAPGGADFPGASTAVHPMLLEACIDFAARAMKEIFPARGPVKVHIFGTSDRVKIDRAERKRKYMNWQCTRQIREFRPQFEQFLTQLPLAGSNYIKVWHDARYERPRTEFVPVDKMLIPYAAASFLSAARKTHVQEITRAEYESRVDSELYVDVGLGTDSALTPDKSEAELANDKIEGRSDSSYNEDGLRTVYETQLYLSDIGDPLVPEGRAAPYILTTDLSSGKPLALYRNWAPEDERLEELQWVVEGVFVPWRGAYGLSIVHIAGGLSAAATGALRALLDSAHIQNFPGALALKGARMSGQTANIQAATVTPIEGPTGVDDIRKIAMPIPLNGPSPTLFQLLEYIVAAGKGVVNTAEEKIADASANAPVGTTLAMIEQGSVTYSAIHGRLHAAMGQFLEILHRIDADYLDDEETVEELGELIVRRSEFQGPMDVVPVSDPNIFSETQRYAQLQATLQLRSQFAPGAFKDHALLEQAMRLLGYPNYEEVLNTPLEPEERNAVEENAVAGDPQSQLEVYDTQDHLAHLETHIMFMASPVFCANPLMAPITLPKLMEHCRKHLIAYYKRNVEAATRAVASQAVGLLEPEAAGDADAVRRAAAALADQQMSQSLGRFMEVLSKLQSQMQQLIPPPPSPDVAKETIRAQSVQQIEQLRQQGKQSELALKAQTSVQENAARAQADAVAEQARSASELQNAEADRAAAAARHTEEMAIATRNAEIAEASERRKQDMEMFSEQMRQELQRELEAARLANARELEAMRSESAQIIALLNRLLDDKAAAAEKSETVAAAKKASGAE